MCEKGWCIGFDPEAEAEAQLRAEGKWQWDRGPELGEPIYDEIHAWLDFGPMYEDDYDEKERNRFMKWLKGWRL